MSLIPSESYSFPDHFTKTVVPSRKPKQEKPEPEKKKPKIVALPDPEPAVAFEPEPLAEPEFSSELWEPEAPEIKAVPPPAPAPVQPEPLSEIWEPEPPRIKPAPRRPVPNPALRRAQAPPPRIPDAPIRKIALPPTLKPKVRWNNRTPAIDPAQARNDGNGNGNGAPEIPAAPLPAQNVIPMRAPRPAPRPPQSVPPIMMTKPAVPPPAIARVPVPPPAPARKPAPVMPTQRPNQAKVAPRPVQAKVAPQKPQAPAPVVANPQADFFETFAEDGYGAAIRRRKEMKFRRFVASEVGALLVLLPLVIVGLTVNVSAAPLRWIMNILTIAAAVTAAVIPIIFYAGTPTLPEIER